MLSVLQINSPPYEVRTRFELEVKRNSEMAYYIRCACVKSLRAFVISWTSLSLRYLELSYSDKTDSA